MAFKFPFTNYHELNLTWVLDQLKKLFEESAENVSVIENYNGRLTAVETELPLVSETAQGAAQTAANAASLAQTAKSTADTAQENAIQAQAAAGQARQEAQAAQSAADAATQAAQQAQATAQNFDGRITQAENNASEALEASRSFENRVQAAINTANNAAQTATNAQGIAVNANQNAARALDAAQAADRKAEAAQNTANQNADHIGNLSDLTTEAKQNLVAAINEAAQTGGGGDSSKCAPLIINSASGAIASFSDGADNRPIEKLVVNIEPYQSGTGVPSPENVRPISGWNEAKVTRTGKNLYNPAETEQNKWVSEIGIQNVNGYWLSGYIFLKGGQTYYRPATGSTRNAYFNLDKSFNRFFNLGYGPFTPADDCYLRFTGLESDTPSNSNIQLEIGSAATPFESFISNQISVTFPGEAGTVYGGILTINQDRTGTLIVDRATADLGELSWGYSSAYGGFFATQSIKDIISGQTWNCKCEQYNNLRLTSDVLLANDYAICVNADNGTTVTGAQVFKALMVSNKSYNDNVAGFTSAVSGVKVVFYLASPITYTLTASEISGILYTLYGVNNIWADVGPVSVDYPADTKLYIDGKLAELQATILENI